MSQDECIAYLKAHGPSTTRQVATGTGQNVCGARACLERARRGGRVDHNRGHEYVWWVVA